MDAAQLRALQGPLKDRYRTDPASAVCRLAAQGIVDFEALTCRLQSLDGGDGNVVVSGLHPQAGGDGTAACSGDLLLQSLVACSGVTLAAVSTALDLRITAARVRAIGSMDFRGTLAVDRQVPVGLTDIQLQFELTSDEPDEKLDKLIQLTERYCVVLQTLAAGVNISSERRAG